MPKRIIVISSILFLFFGFHIAQAALLINEIMYDLDGSDIDWVEVYNQGGPDVDLSSIKLLISNSTSNHAINFSSGNSVLSAGDYGIIVPTTSLSNYTSKWGGAGNIFTSSYSLPNDTAKVEINAGDKTQPISSVTYVSTQGGAGDGNSLQLINNSWVSSAPSPGSVNHLATVNSAAGGPVLSDDVTVQNSSFQNTSTSSSEDTSTTKSTKPEEQSIRVKITTKNISFAGLPLPFEVKAFGRAGEELRTGKYFLNFGDGDSKEIREEMGDKNSFAHTYFYPGDYAVSVEYYSNSYSQTPDVVSKVKIKVVPMALSISAVGEAPDFFVELTNKSDYDMDISSWILSSTSKNFAFPHGSVVLAKNKMTVPSAITHLGVEDKYSLKLLSPMGQIISDYGSSLISYSPTVTESPSIVVERKISMEPRAEAASIELKNEVPVPVEADTSQSIIGENLAGAVEASETPVSDSSRSYVFYALLFIFLGGSAGSVYFIRRGRALPKSGNDFEILDE